MSDVASRAYSSMAPEERRKQMVRAVVASTVGTSIEWYDYFLFATMAALVFPKLFFPKSEPITGTLNTFGILFVGFLARPIGAWFFGTYGDRIGRKATLIATLLFMGIATFLIGLMPTYSTLGLGAAAILIVLRACQGGGPAQLERDLAQRAAAPSRAGSVLSVHDVRVHLRRVCDQARQAVSDLGRERRRARVVHHDSSVRLAVRRDRTQDDVPDRHHRHGGVGLRLLRPLCGRRRRGRLRGHRTLSHSA